MEEEKEYIENEIGRYCELNICPCDEIERIGNSRECEIFEIPMELKDYFKHVFFNKVSEITSGYIVSLDVDNSNLAKVRMEYFNNIFEIECRLVKFDEKHFNANIITILEAV